MAPNLDLEGSAHKVIEEWLLDYTLACVFEEFGAHRTTTRQFNRNFLQGLMEMVSGRDAAIVDPRVLKLLIICNVSDGEADTISADKKTRLEILLEEENYLNELLGDSLLYNFWILNIKRQAVFTFCRVGDFNAAHAVFKRIWKLGDTSFRVTQIREAIESVDPRHPLLKKFSYKEFIDQTCQILKLKEDRNHIPFLLKAAHQQECSSPGAGAEAVNNVTHQADLVQTTRTLTSLPPVVGVDLKRLLEGMVGHKVSTLQLQPDQLLRFTKKVKRISQNKEAYLKRMPSFTHPDAGSPEKENEQALKPGSSKQVHHSTVTVANSKLLYKSFINATTKSLPVTAANSSISIINTSATSLPVTAAKSLTSVTTIKSPYFATEHKARSSHYNSHRGHSSTKPLPSKDGTAGGTKADDAPGSGSVHNDAAKPGVGGMGARRRELERRFDRKRRALARVPTERSKDATTPSTRPSLARRDVQLDMVYSESSTDSDISITSPGGDGKKMWPKEYLSLTKRIGKPVEKIKKRHDLAPQRILHGRKISIPYCRFAWSMEETETLYKAVADCGVSRWAYIKDNYTFNNRSSVNLKDKWRTMLKGGQMKLLCMKYGPVLK